MKVNVENLYNEASVKFEIAHQLRLLQIEFALEYVMRRGDRRDIFDIVIIRDCLIVGIIEVKKKAKKEYRRTKQIRKQISRYEQYRVPVFLADGVAKIKPAVEFAKRQMTRELTKEDYVDYGKNRREARFFSKYIYIKPETDL